MKFFILLVLVGPVLCIGTLAGSRYISRANSAALNSANSLVVLSGTLAALAILIPLGATFLPSGEPDWRTWLLGGGLLAAILCVCSTFLSMVKLQTKGATFVLKELHVVAMSINGTWITMLVLTVILVVAKAVPPKPQSAIDHLGPQTLLRFTVAHDLPELGTSEATIKQQWG